MWSTVGGEWAVRDLRETSQQELREKTPWSGWEGSEGEG